MARQARYDLAQTCRPRKLAVEQRNELSLGRQPPYPRIGTVIFHKSVEPIPRNMLQQPVKYAILMQHGLILFPVQNVAKRLEHRRINAMRLVHKKRTGQPWDEPGHDGVEGVVTRSPFARVGSLPWFVMAGRGDEAPLRADVPAVVRH